MQRIIISIFLWGFVSLGINAQKAADFNTINRETYRLYLTEKWDSVIIIGKQALKQEMDFYYLRMRIGIAYYSEKKYRTAARHFSVALEQNQGDPAALEYFYFSRLFSGQSEQANWTREQFKGELARKLPPLAPRFFEKLSVEYLYNKGVDDDMFETPEEVYPLGTSGTQSTTRHFSNATFAFTNRLAPGVRLSHAFTFLSKSNHYFSNDGVTAIYMPEQQVMQYQYYISPEFATPSGTVFKPMFHVIGTSAKVPYDIGQRFQGGANMIALGDLNKTDFVTGLGFSKGMGKVDLHLGAYYSNLNQAQQIQNRLGIIWFPLGNLNLYAGGYMNSQYEFRPGRESVIRIIPELMFGFAIAEKMWIDINGSMGEIHNYHENNGMILYNSYLEVIEKKIKLSLSIPVTERGSIVYLGGTWTSKRSDFYPSDPSMTEGFNSIYYNALSIYGGLIWRF